MKKINPSNSVANEHNKNSNTSKQSPSDSQRTTRKQSRDSFENAPEINPLFHPTIHPFLLLIDFLTGLLPGSWSRVWHYSVLCVCESQVSPASPLSTIQPPPTAVCCLALVSESTVHLSDASIMVLFRFVPRVDLSSWVHSVIISMHCTLWHFPITSGSHAQLTVGKERVMKLNKFEKRLRFPPHLIYIQLLTHCNNN